MNTHNPPKVEMMKREEKFLFAGEFWIPVSELSNRFVKKFNPNILIHRILEILLPTCPTFLGKRLSGYGLAQHILRTTPKSWTGTEFQENIIDMVKSCILFIYALGFNGIFDSRHIDPDWEWVSKCFDLKWDLLVEQHFDPLTLDQRNPNRIIRWINLLVEPFFGINIIKDEGKFFITGLEKWNILDETHLLVKGKSYDPEIRQTLIKMVST